MAASPRGSPDTSIIKSLLADGPDPELAENLMLFGQFVGGWRLDIRWPRPEGTEIRGKGEVHFGWIMGGRAIQDVWTGHIGDPEDGIPRTSSGTTIRFHDPEINAWRCVWIAPERGLVRMFVARKVGDEIVLEGTTHEGRPERWIYSRITPRTFLWQSVESHDRQRTWQLTQEMRARRSVGREARPHADEEE